MHVIFCSDPLHLRQPDPAYDAEVAAVEDCGFSYGLVDYEALINDNDPDQAVRRLVAQPTATPALYRGWMLRPAQYELLYDALLGRGIRLINDPAAYTHCHYLPESYPVIAPYTPRTVWIKAEAVTSEAITELLRPFGPAPIVVKDYVKCRKHEWAEACYILSAADRAAVERVVRRFLDLQGEDRNEGLVFREFIDFEPLGTHSQSGMPLTKEFRLFFLDGAPIYWSAYWDEGDYGETAPPVDHFRPVAQAVQSRFFTMDIARRRDGALMIVELGDGQVAGLPDEADAGRSYEALRERWPLS